MRSVRGQRKAVLTAVGMAIGSMGALFAPLGAAATNYSWDPAGTVSTGGSGNGNWDQTDPFWFNGTADVAWDNTAGLTANFGNATLALPSTVTLTENITAAGVNFNSPGYTLAGTNTLSFTNINLAAGAQTTISSLLNVGTGAAFGFTGIAQTDTTTKLFLTTTGQITGTGPINVTGTTPGGILAMSAANTGYSGGWTLGGSGGFATVEVNTVGTAMGTGTVTVNPGGELSVKGQSLANPIALAGGVISNDSATTGTFSGPITVSANSSIRMADFFDSAAHNVTISGALSGSGNLTLINGAGSASSTPNVFPTGTSVLTLSGANSGYSGRVSVSGGQSVQFANAGAVVPNIFASGSPIAMPGVGVSFITNVAPPAVTVAPGTEGVFLIAGGTVSSSATVLNQLTQYGGNWYLGSTTGGVSYDGNIQPGVDAAGNQVFRFGGGGSSASATGQTGGNLLQVGGLGTLNNFNGNVTSVIIGDNKINGNGTVRFFDAGSKVLPSYTGSTTVNTNSALLLNFNAGTPFTVNPLKPATTLILAGGSLNIEENGTITNSQTFNGLTLNAGASNQFISVFNTPTVAPTAMAINLNAITRNIGSSFNFITLPGVVQSASNGLITTTANANFPGGQQTILGGYATATTTTTFTGLNTNSLAAATTTQSWAVSGTGATAGNITGLPTASYSTTFASAADVDAPIGATPTVGTTTINSLRFNNAAAAGYTVGTTGDALTIATGGILETVGTGATGAVSINASTLSSNNAVNSAGDIIVIQSNSAASAAMTINSTIIDQGSGNTTGLTKSGPGALILAAPNTFSGNTTLNAGITTVNDAAGLALQNSTVNFNVLGGTLAFGSAVTNGATLGGLSGNQFVSLTNSAGGAVNLSVGQNNQTTNYSGVMSGLGGLTKVGTGTLTLGYLGSYSGATTVNAGKLNVTGAITGTGAVTVNGGGTLAGTGTIAGPVTVVGGSAAASQGSINLSDGVIGTLTLQGGLTVGGATGAPSKLTFDFTATPPSDNIAVTGAFNVNAGGAVINIHSLVLGGASSGMTYNLMSFGSGTGPGFATGTGATVGALSLASPVLTFGVDGALNVTSTNLQVVTSVLAAPATAFWSGIQGSNWSDTNAALTAGNFTTDQAGTNFIQSYPGATTDVTFSNANPSHFTETLGKDFDIKSLTFANGNAATSISGTNTLTIEGGGITVQSTAGAVNLSPTSIVLNANQTWTNSSANPLTVGSNVSGTGGLTTVGSIIMTGTNNYAGNTTVSSGTLQLGTGSLTSAGNLAVNGTLDINGSNVTVGTLSGTGAITNGAASVANATLTTTVATNSTFSGPITDNGAGKSLSLVKNGSANLTLSGANNYTGNTTINAGSLIVGNATALGVGSMIMNGGTLDANAAGSAGGGAQTLALTALSGAGTITDNNGVTGATTLALNQTATTNYSGTILNGPTRTIGLSKAGTGTLNVTNASNTYSAGTAVTGGRLVAGGAGSIGSGPITLGGGTLAIAGASAPLNGFNAGAGMTINSFGSGTFTEGPFGEPFDTVNTIVFTDNGLNEGRTAFYNTPQTITNGAGFTASFVYFPLAAKAADGVTFVIENDPNGANIKPPLVGTGGSLGYIGITKSGAVALNLFNNVSQTGFDTNGTSSASPNALGPVNFHTGNTQGNGFNVTLTYQGTTLTETVSDSDNPGTLTKTIVYPNVDFQSLLGGTTGYVGFTGSSGGSSATQEISNFTFQDFATGTVASNNTFANPITATAATTSGLEVGVSSADGMLAVGNVTVQAGATVNVTPSAGIAAQKIAYTLSTGPMTIAAGGSFNMTPTTLANPAGQRTLLITPTVSGNAGKIDLSNNDLVVSTPSQAATVISQLKSGFNAGAGYWNGNGIVSSAAATDSRFLTTLGYRIADGSSTFDGQTPAAGSVEVKYTYYGDADLNGTVDGADYQQIDNGFGTGATGWQNGDFNYDGVINGSDFALIDNTFNQLSATGAGALAIVASPSSLLASPAVSAVPEPTTLGLLGIGAIGLLGCRRRRNV